MHRSVIFILHLCTPPWSQFWFCLYNLHKIWNYTEHSFRKITLLDVLSLLYLLSCVHAHCWLPLSFPQAVNWEIVSSASDLRSPVNLSSGCCVFKNVLLRFSPLLLLRHTSYIIPKSFQDYQILIFHPANHQPPCVCAPKIEFILLQLWPRDQYLSSPRSNKENSLFLVYPKNISLVRSETVFKVPF